MSEKWLQLIVGTALISLFFTFTNMVPISALISGLVVLVPLLWWRERRMKQQFGLSCSHHMTLSLLIMLAYFFMYTLVYDYKSLIEYSFYRRDGNVFVTFAPLLLLSLLRLDLNISKVVKYFIYWASSLNLLVLIIYYVTGGTPAQFEEGIYFFLFQSHNGAGGFLAILMALTIGYYVKTKELSYLLMMITNGLGLWATDSRGSILAMLGAIFIIILFKHRWKKYIPVFVSGLFVLQLVLMSWLYAQSEPEQYWVVDDYKIVKQIQNDWSDHRLWTFIHRGCLLWPRAIELFLQSPIIGTGFGSYNDQPYNLQGIAHVVQMNRPDEVIHSSGHAHHSYLHILAETGVVGMGLLFYLLVQIRRAIQGITIPELQYGLELAFWVAVLSAFTEHRLFTPAQMLPFTIILGLALAVQRREETNRQLTREVI